MKFQKAAREGWHPSNPNFNGINLNKSIHTNYGLGHNTYNNNITNFFNANENIINSPEAAKEFLESLQDRIKQQLNQGKKLDEIIMEP